MPMTTQLPSEPDDFSMAAALIEAGLLSQENGRRALAAARQAGASIDRTVLELGLVSEDRLYRTLATHIGLPFFDISVLDPAEVAALSDKLLLETSYLGRVGVVPIKRDKDVITVATGSLNAADTVESIAYRIKLTVQTVITTPSSIRAIVDALTAKSAKVVPKHASAAGTDVERMRALANDGPVVMLVNDLISAAAEARASDIHVEAGEAELRVRLRVDGRLRTLRTIPDADRAAVASRLKVMADLNIAERRRPQDGRSQLSVRGRNIDLRISTLPTQFGESIVLRLLDRERVALNWSSLGFSPDRVSEIEAITHKPHGIFLVAGPTGSGKTTTLYTALNHINSSERKIVTVEDPIEYALTGVSQVQVEPQIEMTFARALRAILRQDPDVVMVGEIRDQETAEIAVRAALVGRLVMSTIHTNDAISAIDRLVDLGVPRYMIAATLRGVLSQRLVRRLCQTCSGAGCASCEGSGRVGRQVVSELLRIDSSVAEAIADGVRSGALQGMVARRGFTTLHQDGLALVKSGIIDPRELGEVV